MTFINKQAYLDNLTDTQRALATKLDDAHLHVADVAQELVDTSGTKSDGTYLVDADTMLELKQACADWSAATEAFLSSLSVVSEHLHDPGDSGSHFPREPGE